MLGTKRTTAITLLLAAWTGTGSAAPAGPPNVIVILADDLPAINLWYLDNIAVTNRRVQGLKISSSGDYKFLETITVTDTVADKN